MNTATSRIPCLMGPSASGKTALALCLAEKFACEIISVDSALVYRGMDIGTAKPDAAIRARVPHHLIDILNPIQSYSAAQFCRDARRLISEIRARHRIPLLVGGTMLYFRALQNGLSELPDADYSIREALNQKVITRGLSVLHDELKKIDPAAADRICPTDTQRLQRAIELHILTGKTPSELYAEQPRKAFSDLFFIALIPSDREKLHQAIADRFHQMLKDGLLDEAKILFEYFEKLDVNLCHASHSQSERNGRQKINLPATRIVGYRQIWPYLCGEIDYNTMVEKAIAATRQLAKRQLTWLRSWPDIHPINSQATDVFEQVQTWIASSLRSSQ